METVSFQGADYIPPRDEKRLTTQIERIEDLMSDGKYRTVPQIADELKARYPGVHFPENSIQAQLRNLRKIDYQVDRQHIANGLYEYRVAGKKSVIEAAGMMSLPA